VHLIESLRRAFRRHRRTFAAALLALAVLAALNAVGSRGSGATAVLVAARTIPAGATISASDLSVVSLPATSIAEGAFTDPGQAVGATTVVAIPARQSLTPSVLLANEGMAGPGHVALPVSFPAAGTVRLLHAGSRIDVLGANAAGQEFGVVAADVRVGAIADAADPGLLGGSGSPLVLLEVTSAQAAAIAAALSVSSLSFALH
jgi:Flp pilus assembly protein CpaB